VRVSGVSPPITICGFNNDINTLERAVKERVFFVRENGVFVEPPRPDDGYFAEQLRAVKADILPLLPRAAPLTAIGFVDSFRGRKRKLYENALKTLLERSVVEKDSHVKVFVKYEKVDFTNKADPVPRVISPRSPRYNIEVGRYLRPIEEKIFRSIARLYGDTTVLKGMNSECMAKCLRSKWDHFREPVAVGLDASRFDQHVSRDALQWEHSLYVECFPTRKHRKRLAELLDMQLSNVCRGYVADGDLSYKTEGGRMSGDMNTSLGNCLLMCCMVLAYARHVGVRIRLANNGDDCLVFMERSDLLQFQSQLDAWFRAMGFSMAVEEPAFDFERAEFCQTRPVWVGPGASDYIMVRNPKLSLSKDTVTVHGWQGEGVFRGWMHAVGTGGLALAGGIPVVQEFYAAMARSGKYRPGVSDEQSWGVRHLIAGMQRGYGDISPATRASFFYAFGITPDEQLVMEEFYRGTAVGVDFVSDLQFQPHLPW